MRAIYKIRLSGKGGSINIVIAHCVQQSGIVRLS